MSALRRTRRTDRGAAAVEFALLLPVLLLILAGIVDFGRAMFTQISVTNAAREGARAAIGGSATAGDIATRAQASAPSLAGSLATTATLCTGAGSSAQVTVSTGFDWVMLGPMSGLFGASASLPSTLSSTARMRCS